MDSKTTRNGERERGEGEGRWERERENGTGERERVKEKERERQWRLIANCFECLCLVFKMVVSSIRERFSQYDYCTSYCLL